MIIGGQLATLLSGRQAELNLIKTTVQANITHTGHSLSKIITIITPV